MFFWGKYFDENLQYFKKQRVENINKIPTMKWLILLKHFIIVSNFHEYCIISSIYINRIIPLTN